MLVRCLTTLMPGTADNSNWAAAWGIRTGDGDKHAFIGWVGYAMTVGVMPTLGVLFGIRLGRGGLSKKPLCTLGLLLTDITNCKWYGNVDWSY